MPRAAVLAFVVAGLAGGLPPAAADDPAPTAAEFRRSANTLKQIALAFHNYEAVTGAFPNNVYQDGKALLSWRVLILPYVEETPLFNKLKLDEPWDGPANKELIGQMPKLYAPVRGKAKAGETFYRGFESARGPFGPKVGRGLRITGFPDGTSNTGLVYEAGEPVAWTKPDDLVLPEKGPLPKLGGMFGGVAQVALADGSVMRLRPDPDPAELRKLIDPADGEPIDLDKLRAR
ncbi:MAG TPA: DUF1559 domain-containing protein [Urbifossiella sp.]|jgi:hypothetical protein|nr:DUF1559 domain-containing protein [Urbifossiella sp.]